jgi:hypothetical protein
VGGGGGGDVALALVGQALALVKQTALSKAMLPRGDGPTLTHHPIESGGHLGYLSRELTVKKILGVLDAG